MSRLADLWFDHTETLERALARSGVHKLQRRNRTNLHLGVTSAGAAMRLAKARTQGQLRNSSFRFQPRGPCATVINDKTAKRRPNRVFRARHFKFAATARPPCGIRTGRECDPAGVELLRALDQPLCELRIVSDPKSL